MRDDTQQSDSPQTLDMQSPADDLADRVAESLASTPESATGEPGAASAPPVEVELEEEKVKDEIDIQIDLLKDQDWVVRREAAVTLGEMGDERCVAPLVLALRDGDWQVREAAVDSLGMIGSPAVDGLLRQLRDWDTRKAAIRALGKIKDERVLEPLTQQLRNDEFVEDATEALVEIGAPAVSRLIVALNDKDEMTRKQAAIILGRVKAPEAVDALIEKLKDKDWFTRLTAAAALEKIGDPKGREAIKPLMQDSDMVVKMRVERILAGWKKTGATA
jgi:HEAT repeat protein